MAIASSRNDASIPPEVRIFFQDIKEHPDDDTPRLIFADWLQEHGDAAAAARGEFLRLRVLRHDLSRDDPTYDLLKRREAELFKQHLWTWLGPLADQARRWDFERGLLQITAQAEKIMTKEVAAWARTGAGLWIDALTLTEATHVHVNHLADSPLLANLNRLDLSDNRLQSGFRRLFRSHRLGMVTRLDLSRNHLTVDSIACLAESPHLQRLTVLDLQYNRLDDVAAQFLADSLSLRNLAVLRLGHNRFTRHGISILRQAFGDRVSF